MWEGRGELHGGGSLWNSPTRMRIMPKKVPSKLLLLSPWLERVDFIIHSLLFIIVVSCSPGEAARAGQAVSQLHGAALPHCPVSSVVPLLQPTV